MKIELLKALNYEQVKDYLKKVVDSEEQAEEIALAIEEMERKRRTDITATAGRLSRYPGSVFDILNTIESRSFEKNVAFVENVTDMGHDSITDHPYLVFALQDVSIVIEQTIIAERFCSFTIKSRREVDFSKVGHYTNDFHLNDGSISPYNEELKHIYNNHMKNLFDKYADFVDMGLPKEDARFVLPYSYNSNIIMGIDAHILKDMIISFTKGPLSKIQEIKEFGENLYNIALKEVPFIIKQIDNHEYQPTDLVDEYLRSKIDDLSYNVLEEPKLLTSSHDIDRTILVSAIMRRFQFDSKKANEVYDELCENNPDFKEELMRKIAFEGDKLELTQVSFEFQLALSFAILTHLTRHRTHHIMIPPFAPNVDLLQYKIPPKIKALCENEYRDIYEYNKTLYDTFKNDYNIREEDLIYFTLSGNMINVLTNMDGKTLEHILALRECNKAQWETRDMANGFHKEIATLKDAEAFNKILGPSCETQRICKEKKESCGKLLALQRNDQEV